MTLPYITAVYIRIDGREISLRIPEVSDMFKNSDVLQLSVFLSKCEDMYHRNVTSEKDVVFVETNFGVVIMIHENHMCFHQRAGAFIGKFAHIPLPAEYSVTDISMVLSRKGMLNNQDDR